MTVQPMICVIDTDRSPPFQLKISRSDVTLNTFRPSSISETLFQTLFLQRANSYIFTRRGTNYEGSWVEHCAERSMSVFPMLSVSTTCAICGGMLLDVGKVAIQPCEHVYCKPCLVAYFEQRISDLEVLKIPCPTFECISLIPDDQLQSLLPPPSFDKYLSFKRNLEIESNPHIHHCPKPDCKGYAEGGVEISQVNCNLCGFGYCFYCLEAWHEGKTCNGEKDRLLDYWAKANNVKFCPNCKRKVEKMSGCDHMTCVKCRYDWCWKCGEEYDANHPDQCDVSKLRKRNPPWLIVLTMVCAPLLFPFAFVILVLYYLEELLKDVESREDQHGFLLYFRSRWLSYPLIILLALLLSPLAFLVLFLFGGCVFLLECRTFISESERCLCRFTKNKCVFAVIAGVVGVGLSPVVLALFLIAVMALHVAGLWFLFFKLFISARRRCDPTFMQPHGAPGYL